MKDVESVKDTTIIEEKNARKERKNGISFVVEPFYLF